MPRFMQAFSFVLAFCILSSQSYSVPKRPIELRKQGNVSSRALKFSPLCVACSAAVSAMWLIMQWDASEPVVLQFASLICKLVAKQSWVVCNGISTQFRVVTEIGFSNMDKSLQPITNRRVATHIIQQKLLRKHKEVARKMRAPQDEFFYVFRQLANKQPSVICGLLINDCADPNDPNESGWSVALPPKPTGRLKEIIDERKTQYAEKRATDRKYLRVLQLSDMHVDYEYEDGSESECDLPICCRSTSGTPLKPAGYWGTVGKCDIPYRTLKNMLEHINATQEVDYIMLSGDFINHADWMYSVEEHVEALRNVSALIRQFFPMTPTYWSIGNHEGVPVNSFAPHFVDERFWPTWLYEEFAKMGDPWLSDEASKMVLYRGSYSVKVTDGLRLISLNTGFCENTNFYLYLNQSDPDGTMSWFVTELFKSELMGESVHVLSHIPPGDGECLEGWARNYYRVIQRFSDTIKAQFFGHVHLDHFTVFYEDMHNISSTPIGVLYAAPSVTTFADLNPAYRIYEVDMADQFKVVDILNYSADLIKATEKKPPIWKLLYSAREKYGLFDLSPASWNTAVNSILQDGRVARKYFRNAFRVRKPSCGNECRMSLLCMLRMGHHNSTLYCPQNIPGRHSVFTNNRKNKYHR